MQLCISIVISDPSKVAVQGTHSFVFYPGLIVEVFEVDYWYKKLRPKNKTIRDQHGKPILDSKGKPKKK